MLLINIWLQTFEGNVGNCMMLLTLVDSKIDEMKNIVSTAFAEMKWVWWILWKNKYAGSEIIQMDKPICWIMHHHLRVNDTAFINLLHVFYKLNKLQERVNIGYTLTQFIWISKWYVWIKEMTNKVRRREVVYGTAP